MSLRNPKNYILYTPIEGPHKGKHYLFVESNKRWLPLKNYVAKRPESFKENQFFLVANVNGNKWDFGTYSKTPHSKRLPLPEVIYDIQKDKVYEYKGQLWNITNPTKK